MTVCIIESMKTTRAPALTGTIKFSSFRLPAKVAIRREGGAYLVCTYEGGRCVKRDPAESHEHAWKLARSIREGVSL